MALSSIIGSSTEFAYTGTVQSITIPANGIYKLEAWGAKGGNAQASASSGGSSGTGSGGAGAYTTSYVSLK